MRIQSLIISIIVLCGILQGTIDAACSPDPIHNGSRQRDFEAVQNFVNSKRTIPYLEKEQILKISGDIRAEFFYKTEKQNGKYLRGHGAKDARGLPISEGFFESEVNLRFVYKCDRSWMYMYLNMDNDWGISHPRTDCIRDPQGLYGSGICDDICLKRAYMGYRVWEREDIDIFDIEIGRRPLGSIFSSDVMYRHRFDGILFKFSHNIKPSSNFYINVGPFVIDERVNYFGVVGETGYLNFLDKKIDLMYTCIDWDIIRVNRCGTHHPAGSRFVVSEFTFAYNFPKEMFKRYTGKDMKSQLYVAYMINPAARKLERTHNKQNQAWYAGFVIGEMKKKGEWAFEVYYQWVQAQVCPDSDVSSDISRGNVLNDSFTINQRGKTNFKGIAFEMIYAITDKLTFEIDYNFAHALDAKLGGTHSNSKVEVQFIMAF